MRYRPTPWWWSVRIQTCRSTFKFFFCILTLKSTFETITALNLKKCRCWHLSVTELKNARRNIEIKRKKGCISYLKGIITKYLYKWRDWGQKKKDRTAWIMHSTLFNRSKGQSDSYCYCENIKIIICHVIPKYFCTGTSSYHIICLMSY